MIIFRVGFFGGGGGNLRENDYFVFFYVIFRFYMIKRGNGFIFILKYSEILW